MGKEKVDFSDENVKEAYRHTSSHIMAQAIKRLWPEAKLAIGPAIKDGSSRSEERRVGKECRSRWSPYH